MAARGDRRRSNLKLALLLGAVALGFFVVFGVVQYLR